MRAVMFSENSHPMLVTGEDIEILARTIFGEARGEIELGQIAVAYTIVHRAIIASAFVASHGKPHPLFGNGTIRSACRVPWQYSCWNAGDPTNARMLAVTLDDPVFQRCFGIAENVINCVVEDRLPNATHYYNPEVIAAPHWIAGAVQSGIIGHHRFFESVP